MSRVRFMLFAVVCLSAAATGLGQRPVYTINTKLNPDHIENLLRSEDQHLVAWGAYFAGHSQNDAVVTAMVQVLAQRATIQNDQNGHYCQNEDRCAAISAILNALIERNAMVPPEDLSTLEYPYFSYQAAILAARLPAERATPLLLTWYYGANDRRHYPLQQVAAMLLAKEPPDEFVTSLLSDSEEWLDFSVGEWTANIGESKSNAPIAGECKEPGGPPVEGWPPLFQYIVEENRPSDPFDTDPILVKAGDDRLTYRRAPLNMRLCAKYGLHGLTAWMRHLLLAEMLGINEEEMPWKVKREIALKWESKGKFKLDLARHVDAEEAKLHATAQALHAKGLITKDEADSIRPRLWIRVFDQRIRDGQYINGEIVPQPTLPRLPQLKFLDSRTSYARAGQ